MFHRVAGESVAPLDPPGCAPVWPVRMEPTVSVLMPVRDAASTLAEALDSLAAQTLEAWELVAVDDGSQDGTLELLYAAAARDPRVRVLARPAEGIVAALNAGLCAVRAPLVARMDGDDLCHPERLEAQVALLAERPDLGLAGCLVECFPADRITDGMRRYEAWLNSLVEPEDIARERLVEAPLVHPSVVVRRGVLERVGGYRQGPFPEDYDLWLRLHEAGVRMAKVPRVLLRWRDGDGRLTRTDARYGRDVFVPLKVQHLVATFLAGHREVQIWGAGPDGKQWRPALSAAGVRVARFFDVDPRKIGGRVGREVPVVWWEQVTAHRGTPLLGAVGAKGARGQIREALSERGFREGEDFLFVQ